MKYDKKFQEILQRLSKIDDEECQKLKDEIEVLAGIYAKKDKRLNKIIKLSDNQQKVVLNLNEELDAYKLNLEQKVEEEIKKRKEQEDLLLEQSRLASIAEMIDAVAHQWIQPLNIMWMKTDLLNLEAKKNNGVTPQKITQFKEDSFEQINHLLETLRNFRNFFRPIKEHTPFQLSEIIQSVLDLIRDELTKYSIKVEINIKDDFTIFGNENEFKHIILNLISNSKYAFIENEIKDRKIIINILKKENKLEYIDNAGGIDKEIINILFDMNTTTKGENGTGMGLYMSQKIAQKHKGKLFVENLNDGAKFTFLYEG